MSISIHALREEGDYKRLGSFAECQYISIHALREEGDLCGHERGQFLMISIHALREEGDRRLLRRRLLRR